MSFDSKYSTASYKQTAVSSFSQVIYLQPKNSVKRWTSHTEMHFLGERKPCRNFIAENRVVSFVPLFLAAVQLYAFLHDFTAKNASSHMLCQQV